MGNVVKSFYQKVLQGKEGQNIGIPTGLTNFDKITYGLQRECLYTIMADSGSGKTTFTLFFSVYKPIMDSLETGSNINLLFLSFEMSSEAVMGKLLSLYIQERYNIEMTYADIFSMTGVLSDDKLAIINDSMEWLKEVEKRLTIFDKPLTSTEIDIVVREWLSKRGEFIRTSAYNELYVPVDDTAYNIVVIDHVRLIKRVGTIKDSIDATTEVFIYYRNKCKITGIFVQQTNRQLKSTDRKGAGTLMQLDDAADTSCTVYSSEVVIGIYFPFRENLKSFDRYDIELLQDKFRIVQILKNRYGSADKNIAMNFLGSIGLYREMPPANEIMDYSIYLNVIPEEPKQEAQKAPNRFTSNNYQSFKIR